MPFAGIGASLLRHAVAALLAIAYSVSGRACSAAPDLGAAASSVAEARDAFSRGSSLARSGDWKAALAAFEQSARLKPHPVTTYDIAYCERALGHYARASLRFAQALAPETQGEMPAVLLRAAKTYLGQVSARVVRVAVTLTFDPVTLRADGKPLEPLAVGDHEVYVTGETGTGSEAPLPRSFEMWIDPGAHVFVAKGKGDARAVESRTFATGEAELILSLPPPPRPRRAAVARSGDAARRGAPYRTAAYAAFGVAGVGLAGGAVFGVLALAEKHSLDGDPQCVERHCPQSYAGREARMRTFADLATVGTVMLAVGAGAGTYFLLAAKPPSTTTGYVTPWFGGSMAGVAGAF